MNLTAIVIASKNPVKISAVKLGFERVFEGRGMLYYPLDIPSGVNKQPISDKETLTGAMNRVSGAKKAFPEADFYVGLEGGVEEINGELHEFAWIVIESKYGKVGKGKSCTFITPESFRKMVSEGMEVGEISDIIFGERNSKQEMGAIDLLTNGILNRTEQYRHAVVSALIPFIRPDLY